MVKLHNLKPPPPPKKPNNSPAEFFEVSVPFLRVSLHVSANCLQTLSAVAVAGAGGLHAHSAPRPTPYTEPTYVKTVRISPGSGSSPFFPSSSGSGLEQRPEDVR